MLLEAISNPDHCVVSPPPFSLVVALCAPFRVRFHNSCVLCSDGIVSTAEQASQLVFCAALFKETLRMWPPVPMTFLYSTVRRAPCVCPRGPTAFSPVQFTTLPHWIAFDVVLTSQAIHRCACGSLECPSNLTLVCMRRHASFRNHSR